MSQKRRKDDGLPGNGGRFTGDDGVEADGVSLTQDPARNGRTYIESKYGDRVLNELDFLVTTIDEIAMVVDRGEDAYKTDVLLQRAVEGSANRIGDTIRNKIPVELQEEFGGADMWSEWIGWRIVLAHQYHKVNVNRVWKDMTAALPGFRKYIVDAILGGEGP